MLIIRDKKYIIYIFALSIILFIPFLGFTHLFDWDEINFALSAKEMLIQKSYFKVTVNYEPFWEKPPLFFWMQAISMSIFGVNEFSARFPNVICGIATLLLVFYIGKRIHYTKFSLVWILMILGSFTPHLYFQSGIIDPWFNFFIISALLAFYFAHKPITYVLSGLCLGLAILTKGPVALLVVFLCLLFSFILKLLAIPSFKHILFWIIPILLIPSIWFLPETIINGPWFIIEFLKYQLDLLLHPVASHGQPFYYHPIVLLLGCFPASIFFLNYIFTKKQKLTSNHQSFNKYLMILFIVVLVLFSIVTTKIVHYSSLCYLPLTYFATLSFMNLNLKKGLNIIYFVIGLMFFSIFSIIAFLASMPEYRSKIVAYINDDQIKSSIFGAHVYPFWIWLLPLLFLIIFIGIYKSKPLKSYFLLANAFLISILIIVYGSFIESFSQKPIIDFYKSIAKENHYIETIGFKSYAHYYYANTKPLSKHDALYKVQEQYLNKKNFKSFNQLSINQKYDYQNYKQHWMKTGQIDKPTYLVYKISNHDIENKLSQFKLIFNKGGYQVYLRKP